MTFVTIRVLEGIERGSVFSCVPLPITVGREDENTIQLNDDRISRFHARLQDHSGRIILTDLDSTNGTRVNGHPIQMRVMQNGDVIAIGRCILLFTEEKPLEAATDYLDDPDPRRTAYVPEGGVDPDESSDSSDLDFFPPDPDYGTEPGVLFPLGKPELPANLTGLELVQLSDLLAYVHEQLGAVVRASVEDVHSTQGRQIRAEWGTWQRLTSLQSDLAEYIRKLNNPDS